ncbi:hypothetical protein GCM10009801_62980 [Streptomyces albiaxialis]|uniref:HTH asnC-type domain-containing protein n=1 Tax=Streptomyces albiaxialis TaxID=329523 RepID=A0ABN2WMI2_9ACTN
MLPVLDDADLDLVAALQRAPRAPLSLLGEVLGVSPSTAGRRLARLESRRVLRVVGQPDWSLTGEGNPWHVWLTAEPGRAGELARRTAALPEAQLVATTAGRTDIYAVVQPGTRGAARELLTARLPSMPGVGSARSELVLRALTKTDRWRMPRLAEDRCAALDAAHLEEVGEPPSPAGRPPAPPRPDGEEMRVARLLREDARAPAAKIARELGVAQSTAYRTARQLLRDGVVRPRVEIEPALLGYAREAVVTLTLAPGDTAHAAEVLARHPSARYVSLAAGDSSLIHHGVWRDEDALADFLTVDLAALPGISAVVVLPVLDVLRRNWLDRHDGLLREPSGG